MENKGLNVFNTAYILAKPSTGAGGGALLSSSPLSSPTGARRAAAPLFPLARRRLGQVRWP